MRHARFAVLGGPLEVRLERNQEARGFAPCHYPMVDGEREWQHATHRGLPVVRQHALVDETGSDDGTLRRNDDQVCEALTAKY